MEENNRFKVALTFAGEQRDYVRRVAERLAERIGRDQVFYDEYYEAELARPDLDLYLSNIYRQANLLVPFFSAEYERKPWCRLEWRVVRTLLFERHGDDVMPCRFDGTEIEGLLPIDGYIDLRKYEPEAAADLILQRLSSSPIGKVPSASAKPTDNTTVGSCEINRSAVNNGNQTFIDKQIININVQADPAESTGYSESEKIPQRLLSILTSEIGQYASILSKELQEKLERIHEKYRQGKVKDARNECIAIREDAQVWQKLDASDQSKVLMRLARYELDLDADANDIRQLIAEAKALNPDIDDTIVRVTLRSQEYGAEAGLLELGDPKTITAFNLRLSLLFQASRYDDVLANLQSLPENIIPDTEFNRFHALALLAKGNIEEARSKIAQTQSEHSDWELVQVAAAMIDYWSGIAAGLTTPKVVAAPAPTGLALARSDQESLQFFKKAEQQFATLIENTQRCDDQKRCYEVWRLASIANDYTRQQEAADYSQKLLIRDPAHYRVLLWAIAYKYPFDASSSEAALETRLNEATAIDDGLVVEIAIALCALYLNDGQKDKAQSLLDETKKSFITVNAGDVWGFWQIQRMLADNELEDAQRITMEADSQLMRRRLEVMTLRSQAIQSRDSGALARVLETSFSETGDPHYLLEFCELSFELQEWETIVSCARQLIEAVNNPHTVGLAALACWNSGRHVSALGILESEQSVFPSGHLPDFLWRVKVTCMLRSGRTSEALAEAKNIMRSAPTTDNLLTCMDVCVQIGDLPEVIAIARMLISRDEVPFETLAKMANLLTVCDSDLAKQYLLRARDGLLDHPQYSAFLFHTSSRLDLEQEIRPLFWQIVDSYPREITNVWSIPIKDFPRQQQRVREKQQWVADQYGKGALPIHLIASNESFSLVELLHAIPEWNRGHFAPRRRVAIYTRHGGHLVKTPLVGNSTNWRIHADITSLILAESLNLLDKVESAFSSIMISPSTQPSLLWQMNHLTPQASRVKICQNILRMRDERAFRIASLSGEVTTPSTTDSQLSGRLLALLQKSRNEGGYVVTYLPLTTLEEAPVTVPPELADQVINCRNILEGLKEQGWLTDLEYDEAQRKLGAEGKKDPVGPTLTTKTKLFLEGNIAETLEGAGLLSEICEYFEVWVDEQQIEWARQQLWLSDKSEQLQKWVRRLINRLRAGLENGKYRTISLPDVLPDDLRKDPEPDSLEMMCFRDLLLLEPQEGNVIWTDDRFFNRHPLAGNNVPIIAISEMLSALRERERLNRNKYYENLLALRTGNFRYIPLDQFEILHHLNGALLKPKTELHERDEIVETKNLKKLRCSIAASLLDQGLLQPDGEGWFLHSVAHTVKAAIILLWKDEDISIERARACSNWVLENLFVSPLGFVHLLNPATIKSSFADAMGEVLGEYLVNGILLNKNEQKEHPRQQAYFKWLNNCLLAPCFNADSQMITATAKQFRTLFHNINPTERPDEYLEVSTFLLLLRLQLPEELAEAMGKELAPDASACKTIGLSPFEIIGLGPLSFRAESLIEAFEKAWEKGSMTIKAIGEKVPCVILKGSSFESREESFCVESPSRKLRLSVQDEVWKLLSEDVLVREEVLRRNRVWFDCDQETYEKEIQRIAALGSFDQRFDELGKIRQRSAALYYQSLPQLLHDEPLPSWYEMMPPSIAGLLSHFRLPPNIQINLSIAEQLEQSAKILLEEEGVNEAMERFACLPVRMPEVLVEKLVRLPRTEQIELLNIFRQRWASPISDLHLLDLVMRAGDGQEDYLNVARFALSWLFDEESGDRRFTLFHQTLSLVSIGLGRIHEAKQLDVSTKLLLVWAHAAKLYNLYGQTGSGVTFPWVDKQSKWQSLFEDSEYLNDALHPQRVSRPVFLLHGLSAIFSKQNRELIDSLNIAKMLVNATYTQVGEHHMPAFQLLFDPTLISNQTGSFLGGDRTDSIRALLGDDAASIFSPDSLHQWVEGAIEKLANDPLEHSEWLKILMVAADLPLPSELAKRFREMVEKLDLLSLYKNNLETAAVAIKVIAAQIAGQDGELLREHFERDVLQIVLQENGRTEGIESDERITHQRRKIGEVILDVAVRMVFRDDIKPGEPKSTNGLLLRLIEYASQSRDLVPIPSLFRIIHEMPPGKAWRLWPVLLAARASV